MQQLHALKVMNISLGYILTWINRLFIVLNICTACSVVYIYSIRPPAEDDFTETAFGEGAPLFGSAFLDFVVGYPTGIIFSLIFVWVLWKIIKQKKKTKKFIYNFVFFSTMVLLGWIFVLSAVLPMHTLVQ